MKVLENESVGGTKISFASEKIKGETGDKSGNAKKEA